MRVTRYIWTLSLEEQQLIYERLLEAGITGDDLELALDGRICDLEDIIDVSNWR